MEESTISEFKKRRNFLNEIVMKYANLEIKRFFNIDSRVYRDGAIKSGMKELMGLVASIVMQCEECIKYHTIRCVEERINDQEFIEAISIALIVGGSITIPHIRETIKLWDEIKNSQNKTVK